MGIEIRLFGEDQIFLEVCFIQMAMSSYTVIIYPPLADMHGMKEEEVKQFEERDYRFLTVNKNDYNRMIKNNCSLKVITEDSEGRMVYSNEIIFK